jgi:hypothetical protein
MTEHGLSNPGMHSVLHRLRDRGIVRKLVGRRWELIVGVSEAPAEANQDGG